MGYTEHMFTQSWVDDDSRELFDVLVGLSDILKQGINVAAATRKLKLATTGLAFRSRTIEASLSLSLSELHHISKACNI
jgi:hypothetical protein